MRIVFSFSFALFSSATSTTCLLLECVWMKKVNRKSCSSKKCICILIFSNRNPFFRWYFDLLYWETLTINWKQINYFEFLTEWIKITFSDSLENARMTLHFPLNSWAKNVLEFMCHEPSILSLHIYIIRRKIQVICLSRYYV